MSSHLSAGPSTAVSVKRVLDSVVTYPIPATSFITADQYDTIDISDLDKVESKLMRVQTEILLESLLAIGTATPGLSPVSVKPA